MPVTLLRICALACVLGGCVHDSLVECDNGQLCPSSTRCDLTHGGCISDAQATTCLGHLDQTSCRADAIVGYCLDQVCIEPGCGNRIVETDEVCDDGNHSSLDGCSGNCQSAERCGDGASDPAFGETCDDGNLMSHDGCDSRCGLEVVQWTSEPLSPLALGGRNAAYDSGRGEMVVLSGTTLWGWRGNSWVVRSTAVPEILLTGMVFSPDSGRLLVLGYSGLLEWDGASWIARAYDGVVPGLLTIAPVYDVAAHRVLALGYTAPSTLDVWALDPTTARWSQLPSPPGATGFGLLAYDEARATSLVVIPGEPATTYEWSGTAWTTTVAALHSPDGFTLAYDPETAAVVAVGGFDSPTSQPSTGVSRWTGTGWSAMPPLPTAVRSADVVYDRARSRLVVFGGDTGEADSAIYERVAGAWITSDVLRPPGYAGTAVFTYDSGGDRVIRYGGLEDTWVYTDRWRRIDHPAGVDVYSRAVVYDPVRDAVVATDSGEGTWLLKGDQWMRLEPAGPGRGRPVYMMAFDPIRRRIIGVGGTEYMTSDTFELGSTADSWTTIGIAPPIDNWSTYGSLAFDANRGRLVLTTRGSTSQTFELVGDEWQPTLGPGTSSMIVADQRRGTVLFVTESGLWERTATGLVAEERPATWGAPVYRPSIGELLFPDGDWIWHRRYVGSATDESCIAGEDADGDGLAGCSDPDCWWSCTPACPPHTSCP